MFWRRKEKGEGKKIADDNPVNTIANNQLYFKVVFVGSRKSGSKTSFIKKCAETSGCPAYKELVSDGQKVILELWDDLNKKVDNIDCIAIGFDITDRSSYNKVLNSYASFLKENPSAVKVVIGNKSDLAAERQVSIPEGYILADYAKGSEYFEGKHIPFFYFTRFLTQFNSNTFPLYSLCTDRRKR